MLGLQFAAYAIALWLGCYLLARRPLTGALLATGLGLVAYGAALGVGVLGDALALGDGAAGTGGRAGNAGHARTIGWLRGAYVALLTVPAVCWCAALFALAGSGGTGQESGSRRARRARHLALVSTLFFGLGCGLLLLPATWLPKPALVLAIGADLLVFGWVVAALDAFDAGERLRADFTRSLALSVVLTAAFGGQVALTLVLGGGSLAGLTPLLLGVVGAAIVVSTFWERLQGALDGVVFGARSTMSERRAALLATAGALPRQLADDDPLALDEGDLVAVTRRALSAFGDLPRLAASPLTRLGIVERRLRERGAAGDVLERAAELKGVLAESVARLKPPGGGEFGTTDEWRHYNALYFPYVAGLRPYSRRPRTEGSLTPGPHAAAGVGREGGAREAALEWFRTQVPERTLHNWQRAAARLVALDLRERELAADGSESGSHGSG